VPNRIKDFRQRALEANAAAEKISDPHLRLQYRAIGIAWAELAMEASRLLTPEEKPKQPDVSDHGEHLHNPQRRGGNVE
jgi:hypothetical protein